MADLDDVTVETREAAPELRRRVPWPLPSLPLVLRGWRPVARRDIAPDRPDVIDAEVDASPKRLIVWSLILVVVLPTLVAGIYLFFIASDQYVAEARFAVRTLVSEDHGQNPALPNVLAMSGTPSTQDAGIVADYIHSRAIVDDVSKHVDVQTLFRRPEADILAKLPDKAPVETLTEYWQRMVSANIENTSGIVTLQVRAFRRADALALAGAILQSSDSLVEDLSRRVRDDIVRHADTEFQHSEQLVHAALASLQQFRNAQGLIDPVKSADANGKLLLQLMGDKIQLESQLFVSQRTTGPDAPGVAPLRARLDSVNVQIDTLRQQAAGSKDAKSNLAALISQYEELDLKRQFAERLYTLTQEGLTRARLLADRRAVYLAVFVPPSLPEESSYPLRGSSFLLIAICAFLTWCCGATIWASVLDHRL